MGATPIQSICLLTLYDMITDLFWLQDVYVAVANGQSRAALNVIFARIDDMLSTAQFERCDKLLAQVSLSRLDTKTMICFLAATLLAAPKLPNRKKLRDDVHAHLQQVEPDRVESLLRGL